MAVFSYLVARPRNPFLMGEFMAAYREAQEMSAFAILLMCRLDHAEDELNAQAAQPAAKP